VDDENLLPRLDERGGEVHYRRRLADAPLLTRDRDALVHACPALHSRRVAPGFGSEAPFPSSSPPRRRTTARSFSLSLSDGSSSTASYTFSSTRPTRGPGGIPSSRITSRPSTFRCLREKA